MVVGGYVRGVFCPYTQDDIEKKQFNIVTSGILNLSVRCEKLTTRNPVGNTPIKDKKRNNDCLIFHTSFDQSLLNVILCK